MKNRTGKAFWLGADQALSGASNLLLTLSVARSTSATTFGTFVLIFTSYVFALTLVRALIGQPLLIRASARETDSGALKVSALLALFWALVAIVMGVVLGSAALGIALALMLPFLLVQDTLRFMAFRNGQARRAALSDGLWLAAYAMLLLGIAATSDLGHPAVLLVTAWGLLGALSIAPLLGQRGVSLSPVTARQWMREHKKLSLGLGTETVLSGSVAHVSIYLLAACTTVATVAGLRAGEAVLAPLLSLFQIVTILGLTGVSETTDAQLRRRALLLGLTLALATCAFGALCLALPDRVGQDILGSNWEPAKGVLAPLLVGQIGIAVSTGVLLILKARERIASVLKLRAFGAPLDAGAGLFGGVVHGSTGAAYGYALSRLVFALLSLASLARAAGSSWEPANEGPAASVGG